MFLCIAQMVNAVLTRRWAAGPPGERSVGRVLDGIRRDDWRTRPDAARKLAAALAERGEIAYSVLAPESDPPRKRIADQRTAAREPMRFRSEKSLDAVFRWVCECRIRDRSLSGLRLALARNVRLPGRFAAHIVQSGEVRRAKLV